MQWKDTKLGSVFPEVMTSDLYANALEHSTMKINSPEIPTTIRLSGDLTVLVPVKGRLKLSIGRMVLLHEGASSGRVACFTVLPTAFGGIGFTFIVTLKKTICRGMKMDRFPFW